MYKREEVMERLQTYYNFLTKDKSYHVAAIVLKGSQNYGLATETSDVDCFAFVYPTLEDLLTKQPKNKDLFTEYNEIISIKDVRNIIPLFSKCNPNMMEALFSEYYITDDSQLWNSLRNIREEILYLNPRAFISNSVGIMYNKSKSLNKTSNVRQEYIDLYGYDPKQLIHLIRMYELIRHYKNRDQENIFITTTYKDYIETIRENPPTFETAQKIADFFLRLGRKNEEETTTSKQNMETIELLKTTYVECLNNYYFKGEEHEV